MVALTLAAVALERFSGDTIDDMCRNHANWLAQLASRFAAGAPRA